MDHDTPKTTLYQACIAAGLQVDHHESDLYVLASKKACALIKEHGATCTSFVSPIDSKVWLEINFAFDPFWEKRRTIATKTEG